LRDGAEIAIFFASFIYSEPWLPRAARFRPAF